MAYVHKFLPGFAELAEPFHQLLKKGVVFKWTSEHQQIFEKLKSLELSAFTLHPYQAGKPLKLACDASNHSVGAALLQLQANGCYFPIGFRSQALNSFQRNWSTTEKELYSIKWALNKFQYFIDQSLEIVVESDHKPLVQLFHSQSSLSPKQMRWITEISTAAKIRLVFVEGKSNVIADFLHACVLLMIHQVLRQLFQLLFQLIVLLLRLLMNILIQIY